MAGRWSSLVANLGTIFDGIGGGGQICELMQNQRYHREAMGWNKNNMQLDSQSIRLDALDHAKEEVKSHYDTYVTQIDTQLVVLALIFPFALNVIQFSDPFVPSDCPGCIESLHPKLTLLWSLLIGFLLVLPFWGILMLVNCKLCLDDWLQTSLISVQQQRHVMVHPDSIAKACVRCHHQNSKAAKFCEECGTKLPNEGQPQESEGRRALSALASDGEPSDGLFAVDDARPERWKAFSGKMTGKVLETAKMTIAEAKTQCRNTRNCTGFFYQGPPDKPTNEAILITFCGGYATSEGRLGAVFTSWMLEERRKQEEDLERLLDHRESIRAITNILISVMNLQEKLNKKWNRSKRALVKVSSWFLCASAGAAMLLASLSVWLFLYNKGGEHRKSSYWFALITTVGIVVPLVWIVCFECGASEEPEAIAKRREALVASTRPALSPRKVGWFASIFRILSCGKRRPMLSSREPLIQ